MTSSSRSSGRHAGLTVGKIALLCWPGETAQRITNNGVKWLHADTWTTYQRSNFVSPAFPGYISGHSTFSRSIAELLTAFTGSEYFPGGMGTYTINNLVNEKGPSAPVTLQWATYFDAADQVGLSRIWGGIHPPADDFAGRRVGAQCGKGVWALAQKYWNGSVVNPSVTLTKLNSSEVEVRYHAPRGFYYDLQTTPDLNQPFAAEPPGTSTPFDAVTVVRTNSISGSAKFYRAMGRSTP